MQNAQIYKVLGAFAALAFVSSPALADEAAKWPTQTWPTGTPEAAGLDSGKLADALTAIRDEVPHVHAIFLERRGRVLLDTTLYPYDGKQPHNAASVTKSVMTTLIAIASDQGKLDLDQPALSFFPDLKIANRDARKERITVRHLTGMVSGLDCVGEHDEPTLHEMNASPDWIQFTLDLKMAAEPGSTFSYCSPGMHLLSAILSKATGMTALDFAHKYLFEPLGIEEVIWPADPQGFSHGWGDLHLFSRDAAKIGYLWVNDGNWNGKQIVSKDWVKQSSSLQIKTRLPWGDDYGYGWWIASGDEIPQFAAAGRGGQRIGVYPSLDIVAVTFGGGIEPGDVTDRIGAALVSLDKPLPPNPQGGKKLQAVLASLNDRASPKPVKPLPPIAATISGRLYALEPNPFMLKSVRLDFDARDAAHLTLAFADGQPSRNNAIGLDDVYRMSPGENGLPVGASGTWQDDSTFAIEYDAIASIDAFDIRIRFEGDQISFQAKERTYEQGVTVLGKLAP
jgi:CubicO group peptidase (beta-lactamase class C family)